MLDPVKFLKRLTALMARPYANLVRYHGVFANRSNDRDLLPPPPSCNPQPEPLPDPLHEGTLPCDPMPPLTRRRRSSWAQLLKRVLHVDALICPRCGAAMVVLAFLNDPAVVKKILDHLHLPTADPPRATARVPLEQMSFEAELEQDCGDELFPAPRRCSAAPRESGLPCHSLSPTHVQLNGGAAAGLYPQPASCPCMRPLIPPSLPLDTLTNVRNFALTAQGEPFMIKSTGQELDESSYVPMSAGNVLLEKAARTEYDLIKEFISGKGKCH